MVAGDRDEVVAKAIGGEEDVDAGVGVGASKGWHVELVGCIRVKVSRYLRVGPEESRGR